jgi:putative endonuclease
MPKSKIRIPKVNRCGSGIWYLEFDICREAVMSNRAPWWRRWFGSRSERAAARFLRQQGYRILARNYRCHLGELDLVALDGDCIVFLEVRSTEGENPAEPAASVDSAKQRRLTQLALAFLQKYHMLDRPARFDILAMSWPEGRSEPIVVHHRSAFEAVGRFQMFG